MAQGIDQHPNNKTYFNITFKILLQIPPPPISNNYQGIHSLS